MVGCKLGRCQMPADDGNLRSVTRRGGGYCSVVVVVGLLFGVAIVDKQNVTWPKMAPKRARSVKPISNGAEMN